MNKCCRCAWLVEFDIIVNARFESMPVEAKVYYCLKHYQEALWDFGHTSVIVESIEIANLILRHP